MNLNYITINNIIENLHDGLYIVDKDRKILFWNKAAESISGFTSEEVIGKTCSDNILTHIDKNGYNLCLGLCPLLSTMNDRKNRENEIYLHHKNGHRILVSVRTSILTDEFSNVIGGIELFSDLSNIEAIDLRIKELEKMALFDQLTQLANRYFIEKEINLRIEEYKRYNVPFGLFLIDIDFFKKINDTFGHNIGDEILKMTANTLNLASRPFDAFGRWGGEEFIGIIKNINETELVNFGDRLRILVENSYLIKDNDKINITVSIGATVVNVNDTLESIIERADILLYKSKSAGRNRLTSG